MLNGSLRSSIFQPSVCDKISSNMLNLLGRVLPTAMMNWEFCDLFIVSEIWDRVAPHMTVLSIHTSSFAYLMKGVMNELYWQFMAFSRAASKASIARSV